MQTRSPRHVKVSRRRAVTRKLDIPLELRAPITAEIEDDLRKLVAKFREEEVLEALGPLVTQM